MCLRDRAANKVPSLILDKIVYTVVHLDRVSDFIFKSGHPHWQNEVFSVCDRCFDVPVRDKIST